MFLFRHEIKPGVSIELDHLRSYAETLESALEKLHKDLDKEIRQHFRKASVTQEEMQERKDLIGKRGREILDIFPYIMRNSLFITLYSPLEHELDGLCNYICEEKSYQIKLNDLNGKGIHRAKKYLKKVAGIEFPDTKPSWNAIVHYSHIRNFIVHNDGKLDATKNAKKVRDFIELSPLIEIAESAIPSLYELEPRIRFNKGFHNEVIDTLETFFGELREILRKKGIE